MPKVIQPLNSRARMGTQAVRPRVLTLNTILLPGCSSERIEETVECRGEGAGQDRGRIYKLIGLVGRSSTK